MTADGQRSPLLDRLYQDFLNHENSASFIREVSRRYSVATLSRLAGYGSRVSRRAAVLAIGFVGDYSENAVLGRALRDSDRAVRLLADDGIRRLWFRCGNEAQRRELQSVARLIEGKQYVEAVRRVTILIETAPWIPESWYQRSIALFRQKRYLESANDAHQALEINPYHFEAAIGMGHCYLEMQDQAGALDSFRRALRVHPGLEGIRAQVAYLERSA